jgi:hypothetical protein
MDQMSKRYMDIVAHYEACLDTYGDNHFGVDWPKLADVDTRDRIMLEVIKDRVSTVSLLDFGCGASQLYEFIRNGHHGNIVYSGLDLSEKFVSLSKKKYPEVTYYCTDILDEDVQIPDFDYIVMNGVFTERRSLTYSEMIEYFQSVLSRVFNKCRIGIAFNVMSSHVDWERGDLFHLPFDTLAKFLTKGLSRHFIFRNDYGLYEYTTYVYKNPS